MAPGAKSWLHSCTLVAFCAPAILSSLCHEHDPCHVFLLSPDPHRGEKGQQELALHLQVCLVVTPWVLCHA